MIRTRKTNGEVTPIPSTVAVEFVDMTGKLAVVITQSMDGSVNILTPGDPIFTAYANINQLKPSKVHVHEPFAGKPVTF